MKIGKERETCYIQSGEVIMEIHKPILPMLLEKHEEPPVGDWIFQLKLDGFRTIMPFSKPKGVQIFSRHQTDLTAHFPELQFPIPSVQNVILDGETVIIKEGKPNFELVQQRILSKRTIRPGHPAQFVAFDILALNDQSLTHLPLHERMAILNSLELPENMSICPSHPNGQELFEATKQLNLEGIVAKQKNSRYLINKRSKNWLKIKHYKHIIAQVLAFQENPFQILIRLDNSRIQTVQFADNIVKRQLRTHKQNTQNKENWHFLHREQHCIVKYQCMTESGSLRSATIKKLVSP